MPTASVNQPFHTIATPSNAFHGGFEDQDQATAAASKANKQAEVLGIQARYEVVDGPRKV